ncbi:hypothetical protein [Photobacterium toruni]|uniref:Uncharacterized protein n=1 Tax=Photobacterium toruni TaxID=1935446 RepID=A0ABU6L8J6_9GAMM|nr:hypothetical protein [Photobacterium toruni]MEC6815561.1 hypothetical protein [Photobacterium toruni]MEC6832533.1 hypothetical protein [Photobacterium toruni]
MADIQPDTLFTAVDLPDQDSAVEWKLNDQQEKSTDEQRYQPTDRHRTECAHGTSQCGSHPT